jgi:2'-5' RNA ligase
MPREVVDALGRMFHRLPGARWVMPEDLHLTLRFVGNVDDADFIEFGERLNSVRQAPFDLELRGLGHFPPRGPVRQLWVGVAANPRLDRLRRSVNGCAAETGIGADTRRFVPHISIARFGTPPADAFIARFLQRHSLLRLPPFPVDAFGLYSSVLSHTGAEHVLEAEYNFVTGMMIRH